MAILIDPPHWPAHDTLWSHLISDTSYDELHEFARKLGVPRKGFDLDHYDVPASRYTHSIELGAKPVRARDIVHHLRASGLRVRAYEREAMRPQRRLQYLQNEWRSLAEQLEPHSEAGPAPREGWQQLGDDLLMRWAEPHRSYHNLQHLEDVLLALDHLSVRGEQIHPETLVAAWFHDAIYRGQPDDELKSAQYAAHSLKHLGFSNSFTARIAFLIAATTPRQANSILQPMPADGAQLAHLLDAELAHLLDAELTPPLDAQLAHLLDADLAIFAALPARYEHYTAAVRREYAHVAPELFRERRASILEEYLAQPNIYRSATAHTLWEQHARANLVRELQQLRAHV